MLADFMTMQGRASRPVDEIAYAFVGDSRFNMGRSLLVTGAILGSDVRLVVPPGSVLPTTSWRRPMSSQRESGAQITITDDVAGGVDGELTSSTLTSGSRWASRRRSGPSGRRSFAPAR